MHALVHPARGFPMVRLPSSNGGRPVEVCLVAQLSPGSGDHLFARASGCQQHHETFVDALDEPSAKLFGVDFDRGERTAVYSFAVDAPGHPFHRHAGHRVFTAISGSGGAQLRFCTIDDDILERDPRAFLDSLQVVDVPPDSLFTVDLSATYPLSKSAEIYARVDNLLDAQKITHRGADGARGNAPRGYGVGLRLTF